MTRSDDLATDIEIDATALDDNWIEQPKLYLKWAERLADARRDSEMARRAEDVARAEAEEDVRSSPDEHGMEEKVTEAAVKAAVNVHPRVAKAVKASIDARHKVDILQAAVTALDHRKRALQSLVELHGQEYFSAPVAKRAGREVAEDIVKRKVRRHP